MLDISITQPTLPEMYLYKAISPLCPILSSHRGSSEQISSDMGGKDNSHPITAAFFRSSDSEDEQTSYCRRRLYPACTVPYAHLLVLTITPSLVPWYRVINKVMYFLRTDLYCGFRFEKLEHRNARDHDDNEILLEDILCAFQSKLNSILCHLCFHKPLEFLSRWRCTACR